MASSNKLTIGFLKIAENVWFISFAVIINSDEWQSEAQFNMQKFTGCRAENFSINEKFKNVRICLHCNKQTLALRQASEESACFHSSATIKTWKRIYFS